MDEQTTTDAATQDTGVTEVVTQPEEQPAEAVTTPDSEPQQEEQTDDAPAEDNAPEGKVATPEWLASKGIDPNDPEAVQKLANMAFNSEKLMSKSRQESNELKKSIGEQPATDDDGWKRRMELSMQVNDWKDAKGITSAQDAKMGQYLVDNPQKNIALQYGVLSLDDIYAMSGAATMGLDANALKSQGGKEALQQLANKQTTTAPKGNASAAKRAVTVDPILEVWKSAK